MTYDNRRRSDPEPTYVDLAYREQLPLRSGHPIRGLIVAAAALIVAVVVILLAAPGAGGAAPRFVGFTVGTPVLAAPSLEDDGGGIAGTPPPTDTFSLANGRTGVIAQAVGHGSGYLAIPIGPGKLVTICAARCWTAVSTDAGPNHERLVAGRIADVAIGHWRVICALPDYRGTCVGSWRLVAGPIPTLPLTDTP